MKNVLKQVWNDILVKLNTAQSLQFRNNETFF